MTTFVVIALLLFAPVPLILAGLLLAGRTRVVLISAGAIALIGVVLYAPALWPASPSEPAPGVEPLTRRGLAVYATFALVPLSNLTAIGALVFALLGGGKNPNPPPPSP